MNRGPGVGSSETGRSRRGSRAWARGLFASGGVAGEDDAARSRRVSAARTRCGLALAALCVFAVVCLSPLASASSGRPEIDLKAEFVYATRAGLAVNLTTKGLETKWHAEYATNPNGPWTAATSGTFPPGPGNKTEEVYLGTDDAGFLHHLKPSTTYYARFNAENSAKEAAVPTTFTFTTTAVTAPEVPEAGPIVGIGFHNDPLFRVEVEGPTSVVAKAQIEGNGAETTYAIEYAAAEANGGAPAEASAAWVPFSLSATGAISVAEDFATPEVKATGLAPETKYYARLKATNEKGTLVLRSFAGSQDGSFVTPTAKPIPQSPDFRNVTGTSAHVEASLVVHGLETKWHFEYAEAAAGPWLPIAGAEGVVSQALAESFSELIGATVEGSLTGLKPSKTYYVRLSAKSAAGEGIGPAASFETSGPPLATTFAVHGLHGEALRVMGAVNPNSPLTSAEQTISVEGAPTGGTFTLSFKGQTTEPIAFDASFGGVEAALDAVAGLAVTVRGQAGGPYVVDFVGEVAQPQITAEASLIPTSAAVKVTTDEAGGKGYDTHYHFEYVAQKQFEAPGGEGGFAKASVTPEVDLGSGDSTEYVGADLPALQPGESYRFRTVATNTSPGDPIVHGEAQSLTVPAPPSVGAEAAGACPNEAVRTGPSALLPDCRAFEQLTPTDKEGAQEIFNYGSNLGFEGTSIGEDGDHFEFASPLVKWGEGSGSGQSPYFFSRSASGWQITAGAAQPTAGIASVDPSVFSPNLDEFGFESGWQTSPSELSPDIEYKAGPPGGPYVTVASIPRAEAKPGLVASSADFSKLVLQVSDHSLTGKTHTLEGDDLYEYSGGGLRQANVTGPPPGVTIGSCGAATVLRGAGETAVNPSLTKSIVARYPVSEDGSRVFFEAVPGKDCGETKHLYVRVDGGEQDAETVDIGAYEFFAANREGTEALLDKQAGENPGLYLYKDGSSPQFLPSSGIAIDNGEEAAMEWSAVSADLSTVYIRIEKEGASHAIYRYDVRAGTLTFVTAITGGREHSSFATSPDGRYLYFDAGTVAGLPGGGQELEQASASEHGQTTQVYRYDSEEALIQCMSCASSFDPEPRLSALFSEDAAATASADGDYVVFDTPAALVKSDVDGEVAPEGLKAFGGEHGSSDYSLSSDVYEWRREGVDGCAHVQGCLALITSGKGGFLNILLGTTSSGNDVFFATKESLAPSDNDTAMDIYNARVDGGFPEQARPVECSGDACSTPFAPPSEVTPSSATFQGAGNLLPPSPQTQGKQKAKAKAKRVCKAKGKKRCKAKAKKKAARKAERHGRRTSTPRGAGR